MKTKLLLFALIVLPLVGALAGEKPYNFRTHDAYQKLSDTDKQRLEQVHRDFVLLWGALDMYADYHNGNLPETLDELVPECLGELPSDPFVTEPKNLKESYYQPSKKGYGYQYRKGSPGNRAWIVASVGLPDFPYLAERGNIGLYLCKGTWLSGINPMPAK